MINFLDKTFIVKDKLRSVTSYTIIINLNLLEDIFVDPVLIEDISRSCSKIIDKMSWKIFAYIDLTLRYYLCNENN